MPMISKNSEHAEQAKGVTAEKHGPDHVAIVEGKTTQT